MQRLAIAVCAIALSGCSLLNVTPPTYSSSGVAFDPTKKMTASIDGIAWEARYVVIESPSSATIRFTGVLNPGETSERRIVLQFLKEGTDVQTFGAYGGTVFAQVGVGNSQITVWNTTATGAAGTVTSTRVAANHYVGTFSFDAQGQFVDPNPLVRKVINGTFDIAY